MALGPEVNSGTNGYELFYLVKLIAATSTPIALTVFIYAAVSYVFSLYLCITLECLMGSESLMMMIDLIALLFAIFSSEQ